LWEAMVVCGVAANILSASGVRPSASDGGADRRLLTESSAAWI
jgi:hypothetical protein